MCVLNVKVPDNVSSIIDVDYAKKSIALQMYKDRKASLGVCADVAGMAEEPFIKLLGENGVSIFRFNDFDEVLEDMKNA